MNAAKALAYVNRALVEIGETPITSFTDGSAAAKVANQRYESLCESMLSRHRWEFAIVQAELSRFATPVPLFDWAYAYQMPTDPKYLRMVRFARSADSLATVDTLVWPNFTRRITHALRAIDVAGTYQHALFSDYNEVFIEYVGRVDEGLFPPYFEECVVLALKETMTLALTDNEDRGLAYHELLHGARGRVGQLSRAILVDSQNAPNLGIQDDAGFISGR